MQPIEEQDWTHKRLPGVVPDGEVQLWRIRLNHETGCLENLAGTLSEDERARAARFHFARDRGRYIAARAALRRILAPATGRDAALLQFSYRAEGKPYLADSGIAFNLSHADDIALCALASGRAIGVDVEAIAPLKQPGVISRVFSAHQADFLKALPEEERWAAFFAGWTRKEAIVKAHGQGLSLGLDAFDVTLGDEDDVVQDRTGASWRVRPLRPGPGFTGAVAAAGKEDFALRLRDWRWHCGCEAESRE